MKEMGKYSILMTLHKRVFKFFLFFLKIKQSRVETRWRNLKTLFGIFAWLFLTNCNDDSFAITCKAYLGN